jgi:hypothetical protein
MIIVKLQGGLGNQLFQYAMASSCASRFKVPFKLDLSFLLDRSSRPDFTHRDFALDIFPSIPDLVYLPPEVVERLPRIAERTLGFDQDIFDLIAEMLSRGPCYLDGYWQNESYFAPISEELRDILIVVEADDSVKRLKEAISTNNSICVHIRRGDFVNNRSNLGYHGVPPLEYYRSGITQIADSVGPVHCFVFSDDILWCQAHLDVGYPTTFIGPESSGRKDGLHLMLMSACHHFVLSNSSFGWWAAWLGEKSHSKVFVPEIWLAGPGVSSRMFVPDRWMAHRLIKEDLVQPLGS